MRQLLYVSLATDCMSENDLQELLNISRKANKEYSITGVLIHIYHRFIQCIEGEPNDIEQLITNIRKDKRNKSVTVLRDMEIKDRIFNDWSMGFINNGNDTTVISDAFFKISSLKDLEHIKGLDEELFSLMANFYRSS